MSISKRVLAASLVILAATGFHGWAQEAAESRLSPSPPKTHVEKLSTPRAEYTVEVGGLLDMDNTMTRECSNRKIAFQNNVSLTIANTGSVSVVNPRVVTNGKRRWWNIEELLKEFTEGATNDQEKVYLIWENMRQNRHHDDPLFGGDEFHDPVRWLSVYGGGLCDDAGKCASALFYHLGFNEENGLSDPFVRCLHGHMQGEVFYDGAFQFIDVDENVFFLDRENRKPVSGDALSRDHDLAKREIPYGPILGSWDSAHSNAALFGIDDGRTGYGPAGHEMNYTLRPGERMVFRWDNVGKWAWDRSEGPHRYYANSKIVYEPLDSMEHAAEAFNGYGPRGGALRCDEAQGVFVVKTSTCYSLCGGSVTANFAGGSNETTFRIESSLNGSAYKTVWEHTGASASATVPLDEALDIRRSPVRRDHYVRFSVDKGARSTLSNIRIETDITAAPMALPRLNVGMNRAEFMSDTVGPHEVTVTHEWVECSDVTPPSPPGAPVSPKPEETVASTYVEFEWPAVEGCDAYWIRVSRRPDLLYPYRPNYDLVLPETEHLVERRGMFNPDETYYWRVRPRLASGVWGDWSPTWTFQWQGPMVPKNLAQRRDGDTVSMSWERNPNGTRPVRYDVYGSDERGFSVNKETHTLPVRGEVPGNFLASTAATEMVVVGWDTTEANMNKAYYRVVAVDADGIESCPSDFVEMPRPHVFTRPVATVGVGQPYQYQMHTIRTIGDLQHRYVEPGNAYWEKEAYHFALERGPAWLLLDAESGLLSGTPSLDDIGEEEVVVRVTTSYPREVDASSKAGEDFQHRREDPALKRECTHVFKLEVVGASQ